MYQLGNFLVQLRKENNITQEELSSRLNVPDRTISRWENGRSVPSVENFILLSNIFEVTIDELMRGKRVAKQADSSIKPMENIKPKTYIRPMATKKLMSFIISLVIIIMASSGYFILRWGKEEEHISLGKGMPVVIALTLISIGMFILVYQVLNSLLIKNKNEELIKNSKKNILSLVFAFILFLQVPTVIILLDDIYKIITIALILSVGVIMILVALNGLLKAFSIYNSRSDM